MSKIPTIHNAGSLNIDDVFHTPHIVRPGETLASTALHRFAGGKGLNQSTALARAGASVRHIGRIGEDGISLREKLASDGVDVSGIVVGKEPTGHAIIQVAEDGENAIVLFSGANRSWGQDDIRRVTDNSSPGDILLLQNEINGAIELMNAAAAGGMRLAMNLAPMSREIEELPLHLLDWLVLNELEGRELSGFGLDCPPSDKVDEDLINELHRRYPDSVVVMTLGKRGAIRVDKKGLLRSSFRDVGQKVDSTGAGDAFMGYFLAAEVAGFPPETAMARACAAGALAVSRAGAREGIPWKSEVDALFP